ncbi:MAG: cytochrome B6 [Cyanobacteriota bacterium]|nr:cytochrome B6 [Cyanobacteriota bacterium]
MGFLAFVVFLAAMVGLALGLYFGLRLVKLI